MYLIYSPSLLSPDEQLHIAHRMDWDRKNARGCLGFSPISGLQAQIRRDRVLCLIDPLDEFDDDIVGGWLMFCRNANVARILGIHVPEDHRMEGRGRALVEAFTRHPALKKVDTIQLRCAVDLDANHFWRRLGWIEIETIAGRNKTGRMITCYRRPKCTTSTCSTSTSHSSTHSTTSDAPVTSSSDSPTTHTAEEPASLPPAANEESNGPLPHSGNSPSPASTP